MILCNYKNLCYC